MKSHTIMTCILLTALLGCDDDTSAGAAPDDCTAGEWRVCVTDENAWGRRYCDADGWGPICQFQECTPGEEEACTSRCGTPSEKICGADGFFGECGPGELCDGLDNDCDGLTDEDLTMECSCGCGVGLSECIDGVWSPCDNGEPGGCGNNWDCPPVGRHPSGTTGSVPGSDYDPTSPPINPPAPRGAGH